MKQNIAWKKQIRFCFPTIYLKLKLKGNLWTRSFLREFLCMFGIWWLFHWRFFFCIWRHYCSYILGWACQTPPFNEGGVANCISAPWWVVAAQRFILCQLLPVEQKIEANSFLAASVLELMSWQLIFALKLALWWVKCAFPKYTLVYKCSLGLHVKQE